MHSTRVLKGAAAALATTLALTGTAQATLYYEGVYGYGITSLTDTGPGTGGAFFGTDKNKDRVLTLDELVDSTAIWSNYGPYAFLEAVGTVTSFSLDLVTGESQIDNLFTDDIYSCELDFYTFEEICTDQAPGFATGYSDARITNIASMPIPAGALLLPAALFAMTRLRKRRKSA